MKGKPYHNSIYYWRDPNQPGGHKPISTNVFIIRDDGKLAGFWTKVPTVWTWDAKDVNKSFMDGLAWERPSFLQ